MATRVYLSNIAAAWTIERQGDTLAIFLPEWASVPIYEDIVPPRVRRAHSPEGLKHRAAMLRATTREPDGELIYVASLACLAWETVDFMRCLAAAAARRATVIACDTGRRIAPDATPDERTEALAEFIKRREASRTGDGRPGYLVSSERRKDAAKAGCARIADRWKLPTKDHPTPDLLKEAGVSRNTANLYLGTRPKAQWAYQNAMAQAERNRKRRAAKL